MKTYVALALLGVASTVMIKRSPDWDASNLFREFVVEAGDQEPVHLVQIRAPPGGSPTAPSPPTTPGRGFPTTQQPGMGKDWPAGYGENGFEKNAEYGGYHPEMYDHEPSHKWADPYYDPMDQNLHFRNGTLMPPNRNSREMATTKVPYTNGQAWTYPTDANEPRQGGGPQ